MGRAIRFDGLLPNAVGGGTLTTTLVGQMREWVAEHGRGEDFEIVVEGTTPADDAGAEAAETRRWADTGATWWIESNWETFDPADARRRIEAGPPKAG
ncbi:MAG: hypothetical protein ACRDE6_04670 [Candidatus Limnocylindria bacterium]